MLIPMAQVLRLYIQMFLSYGLYVYIILETAQYRTTFRIFCNITQKTTPEEYSHKMFHISSLIVLFPYGKVKDIFGETRIKFHLGTAKEVLRGGMEEEGQNEWVFFFFFCKIPIIKQDTNILFLRNTYGFQIGNAMEKNCFDSLNREVLSPSFCLNTLWR